MSRTKLILPQADAACGKMFYSDRRTAEGDRIALEIWNRATGHVREGYRLAVIRCRRCGGYHIGHRPIERKPMTSATVLDHADDLGAGDPSELGRVNAYAGW